MLKYSIIYSGIVNYSIKYILCRPKQCIECAAVYIV